MTKEDKEKEFIKDLKTIVGQCRQKAYSAINTSQVIMNWSIGRRIVEQEQDGKVRAQYGKYVISLASKEHTTEFGRGFSESNIRSFRKFYLEFRHLSIQQTPPAESQTLIEQALPAQLTKLSWSHYERLMRVENIEARKWYMHEAEAQMWGYRMLDRNISTQYYERMLLSQVKNDVVQEMKDKTAIYQADKLAFIKSPTVLEFLGLQPNKGYTESNLEQAILNNTQQFLMEMGKGYSLLSHGRLDEERSGQ